MKRAFHETFQRWLSLSVSEAETDTEEFEALEAAILEHEPANAAEAAEMLVVLAKSLEGDTRSDGADIDAVKRLAAWLRDPNFKKDLAA